MNNKILIRSKQSLNTSCPGITAINNTR